MTSSRFKGNRKQKSKSFRALLNYLALVLHFDTSAFVCYPDVVASPCMAANSVTFFSSKDIPFLLTYQEADSWHTKTFKSHSVKVDEVLLDISKAKKGVYLKSSVFCLQSSHNSVSGQSTSLHKPSSASKVQIVRRSCNTLSSSSPNGRSRLCMHMTHPHIYEIARNRPSARELQENCKRIKFGRDTI